MKLAPVVCVWTWRLDPKNAPPLAMALRVGASTRHAIQIAHKKNGGDLLPDNFRVSDAGDRHSHAYFLSEDLDEDGFIDHVTVYAAIGFAAPVLSALASVEGIKLGDQFIGVQPVHMGAHAAPALVGPSSVWRSVTPYVTPKHRLNKAGKERPHLSPQAQLIDELTARGLPECDISWSGDSWIGDHLLPATVFAILGPSRTRKRPAPVDAVCAFAVLTFEDLIEGPLAIGYGSHFGLGLFVPV